MNSKRSKPHDTCESEPCWDYNEKGQVEILGEGCLDISAAADAKVESRWVARRASSSMRR
jgi:hypothetical protein